MVVNPADGNGKSRGVSRGRRIRRIGWETSIQEDDGKW